MKYTLALKHAAASLVVASVMFGVTGIVHAQSSAAKNQAAPRTRPPTHTAKMQQGTTKSRKSQGPMPTGKTRQPTMQNHKGPARTPMEKTHQAIIQGRKDRAQPAARRARDRVLARLQHLGNLCRIRRTLNTALALKNSLGASQLSPLIRGFRRYWVKAPGCFIPVRFSI